MSALDSVMQQAADAAAATPATNNALVPTNSGGTNVTTYTRPTLDSMADSAGISVDQYLTVKDSGFRLGDPKTAMFKEAKVRLDITEIVPILQVRANRQGQTTFIKSYDGGMTTSTGQNFAQAIGHLEATNDKVDGPYSTAEIPVTLLEDVPGGKEGERIGITPPITGVKFFTSFYDKVRKAGLQEATLELTITHKYQSNKKGNEWGVVEFLNFVEADPSE